MFLLFAIFVTGIEVFNIDLRKYIFPLLWPLSAIAMLLSAKHVLFSKSNEKKTGKADQST